ncbi:MAG TPA: NUDIX domain-containing protein [Longimicrobiales bacterium]
MSQANRPVKRSVAFAIFHGGERDQVLMVQRPSDDEDLPGAWGLPAGSLLPGEDCGDAVRRGGRDKLGVGLEVGDELNRGSLDRASYTLEMRLLEARIVAGEPRVPQAVAGVTQYQAWRWGSPEDLAPAAARGSLCSRLFIER